MDKRIQKSGEEEKKENRMKMKWKEKQKEEEREKKRKTVDREWGRGRRGRREEGGMG